MKLPLKYGKKYFCVIRLQLASNVFWQSDKNASWAPMYVFVKDVRIDDIFNLFCIESLKEKYFSYELRAFFSSKYY